MDSLVGFFSMGGYGAYVWPAYLIAAVILMGLLVGSLRSVRARETQLADLRQSRRTTGEADQ